MARCQRPFWAVLLSAVVLIGGLHRHSDPLSGLAIGDDSAAQQFQFPDCSICRISTTSGALGAPVAVVVPQQSARLEWLAGDTLIVERAPASSTLRAPPRAV